MFLTSVVLVFSQALALCLSLRVIDISHNRIRWLPSDIGALTSKKRLMRRLTVENRKVAEVGGTESE